jgi:UDP-N-acetylmuramoylalanine--D-glutamate ligase
MAKTETVLIMGLGLHGGGAGAANYFTEAGYDVIVTDLKPAKDLAEGLAKIKQRRDIRFVLGRHDFRDFKEADLIIKNPGVPPDSPYITYALNNGVRVETDIGIFLEQVRDKNCTIVGVTGTKGKSTTASIIASICSRARHTLIGGNITVSVLDLLHDVTRDSCIILELSSFQLGGIRGKGYSPPVAVFTNFLDDHLNYYRNREEYFADKSVIFMHQKEDDLLVLNRENQVYDLVRRDATAAMASFGFRPGFKGSGTCIQDGSVVYVDGEKSRPILDVAAVKIPGRHNMYNVLAAVSACMAMGADSKDVKDAVGEFRGIEHRMESVSSRDDITFINDSAATTPDAAVQGIESVRTPITLIAGGSDKGLDLQGFINTINQRVAHLILLEGSGTERLLKGELRVEYRLFDNLEDAVTCAYDMCPPRGTVLLSPGFASFGMFRNEFERGDQFRDLVLSLHDKKLC